MLTTTSPLLRPGSKTGTLTTTTPLDDTSWTLPQYDKDYTSYDPAELIRECAILAAELRKSEKTLEPKVFVIQIITY